MEIRGSNIQFFDGTSVIVSTASSKYSLFAILLRMIFFVLSLVALGLYWWKIHGCEDPDLSYEQRHILWLSIALLFFNDPIYAWTLCSPSIALGIISVLFVMNFYRELMLFWILIWSKIQYEVIGETPTSIKVVAFLISFLFCASVTAEGVIFDIYTFFSPGIYGHTT